MPPSVVVRVACLECGRSYPKPNTEWTIPANPGCPECGYVGWMPINAEEALAHYGADRQLRPAERTG